MSCLIEASIDCPACATGKKGGLVPAIYIFNREELDSGDPVATSDTGLVTGINLQTYKYAYKWCGVKGPNGSKSFNTYNQELQEGGYYNQTVNGRFRAASQSDLNTLDSAKEGSFIVVVETNNQTFRVFGLEGGLDLTSLTEASGQTFADDNSANLGFAGVSDSLAPFMSNGDYESTKALLDGYVQ